MAIPAAVLSAVWPLPATHRFKGTGEKLDDLDVFHPDRMASRILGMGDVLSLIERAQDAAGNARCQRPDRGSIWTGLFLQTD